MITDTDQTRQALSREILIYQENLSKASLATLTEFWQRLCPEQPIPKHCNDIITGLIQQAKNLLA